jgi:enoyl-CoA hydratase
MLDEQPCARKTAMTCLEPAVLTSRKGSLGRISLNRPKALNSLTLDMVRMIARSLNDFEADPTVVAVLLTGEGDRGLCAGGDVRALYESGRAGNDLATTFWREEYLLNARIADYPKPYIAMMDGITMGGGVGLSAHGRHRVVTERTRMAMPETSIGFFPDVGGTWLLARAPGEFGTYLGLTGMHIGASDAIYAGLADVAVPATALSTAIGGLENLPPAANDHQVRQLLHAFSVETPPTPMQANFADINRAFASAHITSILTSLAGIDTEFARETRATLLSKSPTSLRLTLRLLRLARESSGLIECLEREFATTRHILAGRDFYEGIRAAVIDKDRKPRWSPSQLDEVRDEDIEAYLIPDAQSLFQRTASN